MFRSAPRRTAARLNRGDTVHAAWSLPWSSCLGTHGRLTEKPLQRLRQRLRGKEEAIIDEISMLPPEFLYQIICRAAQGMNQHALFMGGLNLRLSGDFLQLPPVRSSSFAAPKETSSVPSTSAPVKRRSPSVQQACEESKQDSDEDEGAAEERRQGVQSFSSSRMSFVSIAWFELPMLLELCALLSAIARLLMLSGHYCSLSFFEKTMTDLVLQCGKQVL